MVRSAVKQVEEELEQFKRFVSAMGGELLTPTNDYELVRFRAHGRTSVIYKKLAGSWTYTGDSRAAWDACMKGEQFRMADRTARPSQKKIKPIDRAIEERDGPNCFYCDDPFIEDGPKRRTREHLVASTAGGPNHLSNLFHACADCNTKVGHLSAPEKIKVRDLMRFGNKFTKPAQGEHHEPAP